MLESLSLPLPGTWSTSEPEAAFDAYFDALKDVIGRDLLGYRNHCLRVFANFRAIAGDLDATPVIPALVFHDIALWTHGTVDYIEPSAEQASAHLRSIDRTEWIEAVDAMIRWHHKLRPYCGPHATFVEPFRRADAADFTFGLQGGVPKAVRRDGRARYPNAGFHRMLARRSLHRLVTRPWSPAPMMRL